MSLIGSRPSFVNRAYHRTHSCSQCGMARPRGHVWLVSVKRGKVVKRVCGEDCRLAFDDAYWQDRARERRLHLRGGVVHGE